MPIYECLWREDIWQVAFLVYVEVHNWEGGPVITEGNAAQRESGIRLKYKVKCKLGEVSSVWEGMRIW